MNSALILYVGSSFILGLLIGWSNRKKKPQLQISTQDISNNPGDPSEIVKTRYAQGEITRAEYEEIIRVLADTR